MPAEKIANCLVLTFHECQKLNIMLSYIVGYLSTLVFFLKRMKYYLVPLLCSHINTGELFEFRALECQQLHIQL